MILTKSIVPSQARLQPRLGLSRVGATSAVFRPHARDAVDMKYVLVTGGVVSGLGKGITASSIGVLLKACGQRVTHIKIDPYLNVDAGTMSPFEHGEVFVLDDGGEADLDLGNYERFVDITLTKDHNLTTGKVYSSVIERERKGEFLGKTVQAVPHITDEIQDWIERMSHVAVDGSSRLPAVCIIELGGTVGDIESMPFIEALRQFQFRVGPKNFCVVHVSLVPVLGAVGEQKTKPTQHSVQVGVLNLLTCRLGACCVAYSCVKLFAQDTRACLECRCCDHWACSLTCLHAAAQTPWRVQFVTSWHCSVRCHQTMSWACTMSRTSGRCASAVLTVCRLCVHLTVSR